MVPVCTCGRLIAIVVCPPSAKSRNLPATNRPMSVCASSVEPPIWGVKITFGMFCRLLANRSPALLGSSAKTSSAAQVEEQAAPPHLGKLLGTEQTGISGPAVHVQSDRLGDLQQLIKSLAASRVTQRKLVGDVVEIDP